METIDFAPNWLKKPAHQAESTAIEYEVDVTDDELTNYLRTHQTLQPTLTHQVVEPRQRRWTASALRKKKESLLRQLERERLRHAEIAGLREECIELSVELEALKSRRTSVLAP